MHDDLFLLLLALVCLVSALEACVRLIEHRSSMLCDGSIRDGSDCHAGLLSRSGPREDIHLVLMIRGQNFCAGAWRWAEARWQHALDQGLVLSADLS